MEGIENITSFNIKRYIFFLIVSDTIPKKTIYRTNSAKMLIFKDHFKIKLRPINVPVKKP